MELQSRNSLITCSLAGGGSLSAFFGAALTAAAVVSVLFPGVFGISHIALPIILGVGAFCAWALAGGLFACYFLAKPAEAPPEEATTEWSPAYWPDLLDNELDDLPHIKVKTPTSVQNESLYEPYMEALESGNEDQFKKILCQITRINIPIGSSPGDTPLMLLAKSKAPSSFVRLLAQKRIDGNQKDQHGKTALMWAIELKNYGMAEALINSGKCQLVDYGDRYKTPLHLAVILDDGSPSSLELVQTLIQHGSDLNRESCWPHARVPLQLAIAMRNLKMVELLLEKGALKPSNWEELLELSYEKACDYIIQDVPSYLFSIDEERFDTSKELVRSALLSLPATGSSSRETRQP